MNEQTPAIATQKQQLRTVMRQKRDAFGEAERAVASSQICAQLEALTLPPGARTIAVYLAMPGEPDVDAWIESLLRKQFVVAAPALGSTPEFARVTNLASLTSTVSLTSGPRSLRIPSGSEVIAPHLFDVLVMPGLAFDRDGRRLGQGGGWYDRVVPLVKSRGGLVTGVAFDYQIVGAVPTEEHDEEMNMIVTSSQKIVVDLL
ncbi:MAG TPA: 5-formyltetrahydrofolate cyclo-ligase [Abditibacteriaceae bacterium]|jgi:5-formyltetrahydrofolate cyclo-ligase